MADKVSKQAKRFAELTAGRGVKAALDRHLNTKNLSTINNWKTRGVPAEYAFAAADFLKCKPEDICVNWAGSSPAPISSATQKPTGVDRAYVKAILEECETASDDLLRAALNVLNGTIRVPDKQPTRDELLAQERFSSIKGNIESFYSTKSDRQRKEIQLEIGGRVIEMFDPRQRPGDPPPGVGDRRGGAGKQ